MHAHGVQRGRKGGPEDEAHLVLSLTPYGGHHMNTRTIAIVALVIAVIILIILLT